MQTLTHGRSGDGGGGDCHQAGGGGAQAFSFKPRTEAVDWGKIRAARLDAIVQFNDGGALMRLANSIISPKVSLDDLSVTPPRDVLHLLTLSQLLAEYLFYEKSSLAREKDELLSRQGGSQTQLERLKAENRDLRNNFVKLKKDTARLRRTAEAYEILIKLKAADGGGQALQITSCPYCAKLFQNRSYLEAHLRKRHPNEPTPPIAAELQIGLSDEEAEAHHTCLKGNCGDSSTTGVKTEHIKNDVASKLQHTVQQSHDEIRRLIEQGFDTCRRELSLQFQSLQAGSSLSSSTYTNSLEVVTEKAVKELQSSQQKAEKQVDELQLLKQEIAAMKEAIPAERDRELQCLSGIATKVDQVFERLSAGEISAEEKNQPGDLEDLKEKTEEILTAVRKMENQSTAATLKTIAVTLPPDQTPQQIPCSSPASTAKADGENEDRIEEPAANKREPSHTAQQQSQEASCERSVEENPDTAGRWSDEAIETQVLVEKRVTFSDKSPEVLNSDRDKSTVWTAGKEQVEDDGQKATEKGKDNPGPNAQPVTTNLPSAEGRPTDTDHEDTNRDPINDAQAASTLPINDSSKVRNAAHKVEVSIHEGQEPEQSNRNAQDEQGDNQRAREHYEDFLAARPYSAIPNHEFAVSKYSHSEEEFQDVRQQMIDYFGEELSQALESYGIPSDTAGLSDEDFARVSSERARRMNGILEKASESERFKMEYERGSILEHLACAEARVGKS